MDTLREKEIVLVQIFYLFLLPVFLLYFNIIPGSYRFLVLFFVAIMLLGVIHRAAWTYEDIGFKKDWWADWKYYLLFTFGAIFFLLWLETLVPHNPMLDWYENKKFLLLFAPISILQEIIFRGVLIKMLLKAFDDIKIVIFINALVFALIHVIYANAVFVLPLTFMAGIGFAWMYVYKPNIILISISHTILNFIAMVLGFFIIR
ncbi:MAG: CPBP family intramembrane metalloprotease [Candidatus Pacebacteria bacterium]|nr:CPBP family intramembrane metalloprotease [Candidatus Paceibacterota bacterium]MBP9715932.1 CPBP family intramembrane metalloprotease [Candidatus Paceibacterota bacterium]